MLTVVDFDLTFVIILYISQQILLTYNEKMSPADAEKEEFSQRLDEMNEKYISKFFWKKKMRPRYSVGQLVRISQERTPFFKGYKPTFLEEIFKIDSIKISLPIPLYS